MTESEFSRLADDTLRRIEHAVEAVDADFDCALTAGGVLEIEFEDGSVIVVNKQAAAQELWVAAKSGGFHYRWDGAGWRDTRSGEELFAALSRLVSSQAGRAVVLAAAARD